MSTSRGLPFAGLVENLSGFLLLFNLELKMAAKRRVIARFVFRFCMVTKGHIFWSFLPWIS